MSVVLAGNGRNVDDLELFIIAADGLLRSFSFPICNERGVEGSFEEAEFEFEQLLNSNTPFAEIVDIDNDGRNELLARVVKSYSFEFEDEDEDFVPLTMFEESVHNYGISVRISP
ncbi:hypothetical protein L596_016792 [Steinernema carpocapsae]|uniref:Uncharacterized protein n=1 Tax=Steinernema carpocapsae TaxID=34508 RepID=A0A4U5NJ46_STECR|nr:hypothetical protein L596_016792 [Steinernema carpocapsae]